MENINKELTTGQVIKNIYEARYIGSDTCSEKVAVETILDAARSILEERFKITVSREVLSIIYQTMFIEAYRFLSSKSGEVKCINLGGSCRIGVCNSRTDLSELENETVGNLIPTLEDIRNTTTDANEAEKALEENKDKNASSTYLAEVYADLLPDPEIMTIVEARCVEVLSKNYSICVPFSHVLIVMWKTVYDSLCAYCEAEVVNTENGEYTLTFQGLIETHAVLQDDGSIKINHYPERCIKLTVKNDTDASNEFMSNLNQVLMIKHKDNSMYSDRLSEDLSDLDEE